MPGMTQGLKDTLLKSPLLTMRVLVGLYIDRCISWFMSSMSIS